MKLVPESVGGSIAELEGAEQGGGEPGMRGKCQQRPVDVGWKLPAGSDEDLRNPGTYKLKFTPTSRGSSIKV